jgi:putative PIN family toxin of toxin-antitoxin system
MIQRVVLDTSSLVSAAIRIGSIPHRALLHAFATCEVCACAETLAELEHVLSRPAFDAYADRASRLEFVAVCRRYVRLYSVQTTDRIAVDPPCRDPRDNEFLALVVAAEAHVLTSSDQDLLVLHPWRGVRILSPGDFLSGNEGP